MHFKFNSGYRVKDIFKINNLPLLILDESWLTIFKEDKKNEVIKLYEKTLLEYLKEQSKLDSLNDELNLEKKKLLQQILELSHDMHENDSKSSRNEIENCKKQLEKINNNIKELNEKKENLPNEINEVNSKLFQESIKVSYNIMSKNLKEINKLEPSINSLRERLKAETQKMNKYEEGYKTHSKFLNDFIGQDGIKTLNKKYNGSI